MNLARIAALLRELADELDGGGSARAPAPKAPAKKRRRRVVRPPEPPTQPTDIDRARARDAARRMGILIR